MKLRDIKFPIFKIGRHEGRETVEGVSYIITPMGHRKIIDNKNLKGDTLALRRVRIPKRDRYRLTGSVHTLEELIRSPKNRTYIDSKGDIFTYTRVTYYPLSSWKIEKIHKIGLRGYAIEVSGLLQRFFVKNKPSPHLSYASLLDVNNGYILYGFTDISHQTTRRKI